MKKIETDTAKVEDLCENIEKDINEYNTNISTLFDLLKNFVNNKTWVGNDAIKYADYAVPFEENYNKFGNDLIDFLNILKESNSNLQNKANDTRVDGGEKK